MSGNSPPPYTSDEKADLGQKVDLEAAVATQPLLASAEGPIADDTPLSVGNDARTNCKRRFRRFVLFFLFTWVTFHLATFAFKTAFRSFYNAWQEDIDFSYQPVDEWWVKHSESPSQVVGPVVAEAQVHDGQMFLNASFPLRQKRIGVSFQNVTGGGKVIVSRADIPEPSMVVESVWTQHSQRGEVILKAEDDDIAILTVNCEQECQHIVHVVLPNERRRIKDLAIRTIANTTWPDRIPYENLGLELVYHESVDQVHIKHLDVQSVGKVVLPPSISSKNANIRTVVGDITGEFNVRDRLDLRAVTGNINATVHVLPPHHKHKKPGDGDDKPKKPEDATFNILPVPEIRPFRMWARDCHGKGMRKAKAAVGHWFGRVFNKEERDDEPDHKHPKHPHPPHGKHHHNAVITAHVVTGNITLDVHKPPFVETHTAASAVTGDVDVHAGKHFYGRFGVNAAIGSVSYHVVDDERKTIKVLSERKSPAGQSVRGVIVPKHPHRPKPEEPEHEGDNGEGRPHHHHHHHGDHGHHHGDGEHHHPGHGDGDKDKHHHHPHRHHGWSTVHAGVTVGTAHVHA